MQRYKVCHIPSNFWDILHGYVTDGVINCRNVTNGMVVLQICIIFANSMDKGHKETVSIRFVSTAFMILAIAIFKPFGLEAGQWQSYIHLLCLFALGLFSCFITEVILRYILHMPRSYDRGVSYIISRNLRFQLINTPWHFSSVCIATLR